MKSMIAALALAILAAPALAEDNVVMVLDTSLSMSESMVRGQSKMEAAQQAILRVLQSMPKDTNLGIVTFNGWAVPLGRVDLDGASKAVLAASPSGGTPLGQYVKIGADALLQKRAEAHGRGTYTLLVVTDGEASDQAELDRFVPDILSRGITLKTIGVKMAQDHTLKAQSVAYYQGNDLQSLQKSIATAIAEVSSTDQDAGEQEYAMLKGIPDDMAAKVISALAETNSLNHPIGEAPPVKVVDPQGNVTFQPAPATQPDSGGLGVGGVLLIVVVVVFAAAVMIVIVRANSRGY